MGLPAQTCRQCQANPSRVGETEYLHRISSIDMRIVKEYAGPVIQRPALQGRIEQALSRSPVVTILGPRQCGKTTIARSLPPPAPSASFDLENPVDRARLANPLLALERLNGLVVIDEVQKEPGLFPVIRVLVDRPDNRAKFLLLGSAAPGVIKGASESLAGRSAFIEMSGFSVAEIGPKGNGDLWFRGSFPRSYLANDDAASAAWREDLIRTFLERDIPQLGISVPAATLRRFWTMVAHFHGNVWNAAEFARSLGTSEGTARRYLDILTGSYLVRQLPPWFENMAKRQVKAPKVYLRDSGLLHSLLSTGDRSALPGHPKYGASWEGFAIEQIAAMIDTRDAYFWSTYSGAELDLLIFRNGKRIGFEMKCADAPALTRSMGIALLDLSLDRLYVVYPGELRYPLAEKVEAVPLAALPEILTS
jgi:predicted AAA+ superfamily ATPase